MEQMDMRDMLLSELIDKMHSRLADKMFPKDKVYAMPDTDKGSEPAAAYPTPGASDTAEEAYDTSESPVTDHGAENGDATGIPDEDMSEEDLEEMLKQIDK